MTNSMFELSAEKSNKRYKWVTEPNACKKCKALEGKIFETLEEFEAARPHPHCKCSFEVLLETPEQVVQNITPKQDLMKEATTLEKELEEALHKYKRLLEAIELQEEFIDEPLANKALLSTGTLNKLSKEKDKLSIHKEEVIKIIKQITEALVEVRNIKNHGSSSGNVENTALIKFYNNLKTIDLNLQNIELSALIWAAKYFDLDVASGLWQIASTKLDPNRSYIKKNGKILNSFIDVDEPSIRTEVKDKLESQHMTLKSKGVLFRYNSSIAEEIINSYALKKYIRENKYKFKINTHLPKTSFPFKVYRNPDLYVAIHNTDMTDIYIDFYENFTAKIIDTYDFNEGEKYLLVQMGNAQQKAGNIEPYFIIVDIIIPKEIWEKY